MKAQPLTKQVESLGYNLGSGYLEMPCAACGNTTTSYVYGEFVPVPPYFGQLVADFTFLCGDECFFRFRLEGRI